MKANNLNNGTMNNIFDTQPTGGLKARFGVRKGLWAALALILVLAGANALDQSTVSDTGDMISVSISARLTGASVRLCKARFAFGFFSP